MSTFLPHPLHRLPARQAVVRLATMCSLPTDEDLREAGAADAGEYLITLLATDPSGYELFLRERKQSWDRLPRQSAHRCVDHLLSFITRTVEGNTAIRRKGATSDEVEEVRHTVTHCYAPLHAAAYCHTLSHVVTCCSTLFYAILRCYTLSHASRRTAVSRPQRRGSLCGGGAAGNNCSGARRRQ